MSASYPHSDPVSQLEAVCRRNRRFHFFCCLPLQPRELDGGEMVSIVNDGHIVRAAGMLSMTELPWVLEKGEQLDFRTVL